jgi:hypothetical protein
MGKNCLYGLLQQNVIGQMSIQDNDIKVRAVITLIEHRTPWTSIIPQKVYSKTVEQFDLTALGSANWNLEHTSKTNPKTSFQLNSSWVDLDFIDWHSQVSMDIMN